MIVVDTNVLLAFFVETPMSDLSHATFERDSYWSAPWLWRSELRNVLLMHVRHDVIEPEHAFESQLAAEVMLAERELEVDSATVLNLAMSSGCTAYDCEYVALAQHLTAPLVTLDSKLLRAFPTHAVSPADFVES